MREEWRVGGAADLDVARLGKGFGERARCGGVSHAVILAGDDQGGLCDVAEQRPEVGIAQQLEVAGQRGEARMPGVRTSVPMGEERGAELRERSLAAGAAAHLKLEEVADGALIVGAQGERLACEPLRWSAVGPVWAGAEARCRRDQRESVNRGREEVC